MTHFYERNIVEIKDEYTTFLINIITPLLYEGLKSIYNNALTFYSDLEQKRQEDPSIENPGILKIFQLCLKEIPSLNSHVIDEETKRLKEMSKCSEWFDDLVKAVVKSNIVLLTFNIDKKPSKIVDEKYHERIDTNDFVHKCYIECARMFYNYPELFWHEYNTLEIKRNQREICDIIKKAIKESIRKMLPMKLILKEFLKNDYLQENTWDISDKMSESHFMNIKKMIDKDINYSEYSESNSMNLLDNPLYEMSDDASNKFNELVYSNATEELTNKIEEIKKEINIKEFNNINLNVDDIENEIKEIESRYKPIPTVSNDTELKKYFEENNNAITNIEGKGSAVKKTEKFFKDTHDEIKSKIKVTEKPDITESEKQIFFEQYKK